MGNEVVRLADVVVPEIYSKYLIEDSIKTTRLYRSGILEVDPLIVEFLGGGGDMVNIPFWQRDTSDPQAIQSDYTITTNKIGTSKMVGRRLLFGNAWSAEELASALAGADAMEAIKSQVDLYWEESMQKLLYYTIKGIIADNIDSNSSDLIHDITTSGTPAASNKASASAVVDAFSLLGDKSDFAAIAMNSVVYYTLVKLNLISTVPSNIQDIGWGTFLGMTCVVCDELTKDTDVNAEYTTILFKKGAIRFGESGARITTVEIDRKAEKSEDRLFTRRQFCFHPYGWKWIETSVHDAMPTMIELSAPGNWGRVMNAKNSGMVFLISNG